MNTTVHISDPTVIVVPTLARLTWRERVTLAVSIWVIERTLGSTDPGQTHLDQRLRRACSLEVERREHASLCWLPPMPR